MNSSLRNRSILGSQWTQYGMRVSLWSIG
jgi:hypothetical protein